VRVIVAIIVAAMAVWWLIGLIVTAWTLTDNRD
jgi:hypothetical protein